MKFILMIEDNGYEVRYWDQINDEIGESIASNWDKEKLYKTLNSRGFHIAKKELYKAISTFSESKEPFVVLASHPKSPIDLDTFMNDLFVVDEEKDGIE
jgi:hypothetical protein